MLTRVVSGIIGVIALVIVLVCLPGVATEIAVAIVAAIALYEFYHANLQGDKSAPKLPLVIAGYVFGFALMFVKPELLLPVVSAGVLGLLSLTVVFHKKIVFHDCTVAYLGAVYIFAALRHVSMVRLSEGGTFLVFAIFIGAFVTDTGAYFAGFFFGKHKLAPEISPKKTVEGAVGGVVVTILAFLVYGYLGEYFMNYEINSVNLVIISIVLSVVSQVGDLCASVIKRELGIKDYGNIMPGHGGALDRFDSVLFVAPLFYYMNSILPIFVIK